MLLPIRTELAPDRLPIGTLALVVLNVLAFPLIYTDLAGELILTYGELAPWQWLSSSFLHAGPLHLAGNLFFLWSFGLIVESFLGWQRFLAFYLAIAVAQSGLEQCLAFVLDSPGISLGASSAIYGLMAAALLWAPTSEIQVLFGMRFRDIAVFWFGGTYLAWDLLGALRESIALGTPLLHLQGALLGGLAAWGLLRAKHIDTGGHDLLALFARGASSTRKGRNAEPRRPPRAPSTAAVTRPSAPAALSLRESTQQVLEEIYFGGAESGAARCLVLLREGGEALRGLPEAVLEKLADDEPTQRAFAAALDQKGV